MRIKFLTVITLAVVAFLAACGKSDADVQKAVAAKLAADNVTGVAVAVKDGVATLSGEVADITHSVQLAGEFYGRVLRGEVLVDFSKQILLFDAEVLVEHSLKQPTTERGGRLRAVVEDRRRLVKISDQGRGDLGRHSLLSPMPWEKEGLELLLDAPSSDGLPVRQVITFDAPAGGGLLGGMSMKMTIDFTDWGTPVDVQVPPADQVQRVDDPSKLGQLFGGAGTTD